MCVKVGRCRDSITLLGIANGIFKCTRHLIMVVLCINI